MSDSSPHLTTLPAELILRIFECDAISHHELKALRLVCQSFSGPATQALFSRICISKLNSDREAFLNIATRPYLARAVQTVVWYELAEDDLCFVHLLNPRTVIAQRRPVNSVDRPQFAADIVQELDSMAAQSRAMFWLPFEDPVQYEAEETESKNKKARIEARTSAIEDFMDWFYTALDHMPNLTTFISQPMHPLRELRMPSGNPSDRYPMTAQIFQRGMHTEKTQMNEGFCTFMMPYIAHRAKTREGKHRPLLPITRLHLADESHFSFITRLKPEFSEGFACLRRLDLCISQIETMDTELPRLAACVRAAANLTELRLCFERCEPPKESGRSGVFDAIFPSSCFHPVSVWPNLRTLHLGDLPFTTDSLVRVAKGLAGSLKILRLDTCPMTMHALGCLASIPELKLDSFVVTSEYGPGDDHLQLITEPTALKFLNGERQLLNPLPENADEIHIHTHVTVFDLCGWRTAAIIDSRNIRPGYSVAEMRELEREDVDEEDMDIEEDIHLQTSSESGASDDNDDNDNEDENENDDDDDENDEDEDDAYKCVEAASHRRRILSAPRWNWSRASDGNVYYWKVIPRDAYQKSYPTETWRFTHRNGEWAMGDDPLEYWSDWEGSEAGDVSEATPHGRAFDRYVKSDRGWGDSQESLIPFGRALKWVEPDEAD